MNLVFHRCFINLSHVINLRWIIDLGQAIPHEPHRFGLIPRHQPIGHTT